MPIPAREHSLLDWPDVPRRTGNRLPDRVDGPVMQCCLSFPRGPRHEHSIAAAMEPTRGTPELSGPQPVDAYIRRALAENRTVQAAFHNVQSLEYRIPQVTALDDPVASNTMFPIPSVAPQYSLMGYNPYNLTLAQQFPWFGTMRLRGEVADRDVRVALAELAAAQLDSVTAVKRAYSTSSAERTAVILAENRKVLEDFRAIARSRLDDRGHAAGRDPGRDADQRAGPRRLAGNQQAIAAARAAAGASRSTPAPSADLQTDARAANGRGPGRDRAPLPTGDRRSPRAARPAGGHRPRREGRRAGPQAVLSQRHPRPDLHGHGEDGCRRREDGRRFAERRPVRRLQLAGLPQ